MSNLALFLAILGLLVGVASLLVKWLKTRDSSIKLSSEAKSEKITIVFDNDVKFDLHSARPEEIREFFDKFQKSGKR